MKHNDSHSRAMSRSHAVNRVVYEADSKRSCNIHCHRFSHTAMGITARMHEIALECEQGAGKQNIPVVPDFMEYESLY